MANVFGTVGNDDFYGGAGADTYYLYSGDDYVRPDAGADAIFGGSGSDRVSYWNSPAPVLVYLDTGEGHGGDAAGDTYNSVENVTGSSFNDFLRGNSAANTLNGRNGDDQIKGSGGADSLVGGNGRDAVSYGDSDEAVTVWANLNIGTGGDAQGDTYSSIERFRGSDYDDLFHGSAGDDDFEGGDGNDTFKGSAGADSLVGDDGLDVVDYSNNTEAVIISVSGVGHGGDAEGDTYASIEGIVGSDYNDQLFGTNEANHVQGGDGDDLLKGFGGNDTLIGNDGDDSIIGAAGNDRMLGGAGSDSINGGAGADYLDGGAGADTMAGGLNNDFYIVDNAGDVIEGEIGYAAGGGIDTVRAFIDYTQPTNIELVRLGNLGGTANLSATGNDAPGTLVGNAGNNVLVGRGGNDQLNGNDGNDTITGNTGIDTLVGGAGADTFVYTSIADSRAGAAHRDVINGFDHGADRINLSSIDANTTTFGVDDAFNFIGTNAFSEAGQLRVQGLGGPNALLVEGDHNGDGVADFQIFVNLTTAMSAGDFIL